MHILRKPDAVRPFLGKVQRIADAEKSALGFLPATVYREQMYRQRLWLAVEDDELLAFLMFGGRFPTLKIRQLGVRKEARGKKVGKTLIASLTKYGERRSYLRIVARVAADLPANGFWDSQGLELIKQVPGGATTQRLINIRVKTLNSPSLLAEQDKERERPIQEGHLTFSSPLHSTPSFAIDLNIFFDVTKKRVDHEYSSRVLGEGFRTQVRLFITPEFVEELERRHIDPDPNLEIAKSLPHLEKADEATMTSLTHELKSLVFPRRSERGKRWPQSKSDLRHLAYCINARITGFITREFALLKAAAKLKENFDLEVVSPLDVCGGPADSLSDYPITVSTQGGDEISARQGNDHSVVELVTRLCGRQKEKPPTHELFDRTNRRLCIFHNESIIGAAAWKPTTRLRPDVKATILIDETSLLRERAVDHILESIFREGIPLQTRTINLHLPYDHESLYDTAWKRGFRRLDGESQRLIKQSATGVLEASNWPAFIESLSALTGLRLPIEIPEVSIFENTGICAYAKDRSIRGTLRLFEFETLFSPGLVLCPGRQALIVPIRFQYAKDLLLDPSESGIQLSFLPGNTPLFLERAYFRSPRGQDDFKRGTPIVFYVSKASGGFGEVVGWARCTYSDTPTVQQARRVLSRQGVLTDKELSASSNDGRLHAFSFDNFNIFPRRISLKTLKSKAIVTKANMVTYQRIDFDQLSQILQMAYGEFDQ